MDTVTQKTSQQEENLRQYRLSLLKKIKNKQMQKKANQDYELQGIEIDNKPGLFDRYVDYVAVKTFIIETLQSRLNIHKDIAVNFMSKLSKDDVFVLSKNLIDFIDYIKDKNRSAINDYILKSSFDVFKRQVMVNQQVEMDNRILQEHKEESKEAVDEAVQVSGPAEEPSVVEAVPFTAPSRKDPIIAKLKELDDDLRVPNKAEFYRNLIPKIQGEYSDFSVVTKGTKLQAPEIRDEIKKFMREKLRAEPSKFSEYMSKYEQIFLQNLQDEMARPSSGKGVSLQYKPLGKYYINEDKLNLYGKVQIRSGQNKQIFGARTMTVTPKVKVILRKIIIGRPLAVDDVVELSEDEQDVLYELAKSMKIKELMSLPSRIKTQEEKLITEYQKLRGEILAGNDSPAVIKQFKLILYKLKAKKMITNLEYTELTQLLLQLD